MQIELNNKQQQDQNDSEEAKRLEDMDSIAEQPTPINQPLVQSIPDTTEDLTKSSSQMINRLQNLKDQCSNIESNMDMMIESSKALYPPARSQNASRPTMPTPGYYYQDNESMNTMPENRANSSHFPMQEMGQDLYPKVQHTFRAPQPNYTSEGHELQNKESVSMSNVQNDQNLKMYDLKQAIQNPQGNDSFKFIPEFNDTFTPQRLQQTQQIDKVDSLREEMNTMRIQQDKILEMQNAFQFYITNELKTVKERLNQLETAYRHYK